LLASVCERAWVGRINFYEKADVLREIYAGRGRENYLLPAHEEQVRAALRDAGLLE
jgi:hypothetical protein